MLKTKLFKGFAALVIIFAVLSAFISMGMIQSRVIEEAQRRVLLDLESAWAVYNARLREVLIVLKLATTKDSVVTACTNKEWNSLVVKNRLELIRNVLHLDFLGIVSPAGEVVMRTSSPYNTGDYRISNPLITRALKGESVSGTVLFSQKELEQEAGEKMVDQAFMDLKTSPHARLSPRESESRGIVMMGASPVMKGGEVIAVLYGGILLNKNYEIIDDIKKVVYKDETYEGVPKGTATIFLNDVRVATTVRFPNGNRAIGTRVSREVAESVLDNGIPWVGRAFVVNDWYLTVYDPIRDCENKVIGMLYVGFLEKPFQDVARTMIMRYAILSIFGIFAALVFAFILAGRLSRPINQLDSAANKMRKGEHPGRIAVDKSASKEVKSLVNSFNEMAQALAEREENLKDANEKLAKTNESLKATNHSYMETLGFVSHELKGPVATIMNYVYLIKESKVGPLTEKQSKAIGTIDRNVNRIVEMIRHYLNLSRIENGVLQPVKTCVHVMEDVVGPLLESYEPEITTHKMIVENSIPADTTLYSDLNMTREVFENLISNAIKYGRESGKLILNTNVKDGFVEFAVRNEGEGIPPEKIDTLFQKFSRVEDSQNPNRQKGTGLGLFITKHIIEAHGGSIEVQSRLKEWTEFRFSLPSFKEKENI